MHFFCWFVDIVWFIVYYTVVFLLLELFSELICIVVL